MYFFVFVFLCIWSLFSPAPFDLKRPRVTDVEEQNEANNGSLILFDEADGGCQNEPIEDINLEEEEESKQLADE